METREWHVMEHSLMSPQTTTNLRHHGQTSNLFVKQKKADSREVITLTFCVLQKNIDDIALSIADPKSASYGKHLSREEIKSLTENVEGENAVRKYLTDNGITDLKDLSTGSYISADAPVEVWNRILNTCFYEYVNSMNGQRLIRSEQYSLPSYLAPHVQSVSNTVQFPAPMRSGPRVTPMIKHNAELQLQDIGIVPAPTQPPISTPISPVMTVHSGSHSAAGRVSGVGPVITSTSHRRAFGHDDDSIPVETGPVIDGPL